MSKIVKGIGKGLKGIVKGARKVFKAVTESKIGQIAMVAGAIYLGGAALGSWNSPWASVNGAWVSGAGEGVIAGAEATGALDATAAGLSESLGALPGAAPSANLALTPGVDTAAASVLDLATPSIAGPSLTPGVNTGILNAAITPTTTTGGVMGALQGAGSYAMANPLLPAIGINAVASAAGADEARKAEEELRKRRERNLAVGGIDLGVSPGGAQAGNPQGFINSRIRA